MSREDRLCLVDLLQKHYAEPGWQYKVGMLLVASFECPEKPNEEAHRLAKEKGMRIADGGAAFNRRVDIERPINMVDLAELEAAMEDVREVYGKI